jgi:hypothetical protein
MLEPTEVRVIHPEGCSWGNATLHDLSDYYTHQVIELYCADKSLLAGETRQESEQIYEDYTSPSQKSGPRSTLLTQRYRQPLIFGVKQPQNIS